MEHLNEDLQPRMMPDFKFYKGLSFTRKKNDEYFTWSEIRYGSILKMNGATHKKHSMPSYPTLWQKKD